VYHLILEFNIAKKERERKRKRKKQHHSGRSFGKDCFPHVLRFST
jgi:hypothetical protein